MMVELKRQNFTARSTVLAATPVMVKDKSGEGGHTAGGLDPIYDGVQLDVLQRSRSVMACRINKSHDVWTATWNVSSMVRWWSICTEERLTSIVLKRPGRSANMFGVIGRIYNFDKAVIRGLPLILLDIVLNLGSVETTQKII